MKYKVVVVDDKPLIRKSLIETINWIRLNCQPVGEAGDGLKAQEVIKREKPDLLITDIKMPGMDGLELTKYVKEILPNTKIIMITGYQEFEYAKGALSLGVCDLILKPIKNEKLEECIEKALEELRKQRANVEEMIYSRKARQRQLLMEVVKGRRSPEQIGGAEIEQSGLSSFNVTFVFTHIRNVGKEIENQIKNNIMELMEGYQKTCSFEILELVSENKLVIAVLDDKKKSVRKRKINLKICLQEINIKMQIAYKVSCFFVVSRMTENIQAAIPCCQEAQDMFQSQYFFCEENILFVDSYTFPTASSGRGIIQKLDEFYRDLQHMEEETMLKKATDMLTDIVEGSKGNVFQVKCLLSEICITLLRHYRKENSTNEILEEIDKLEDIQSVEDYLLQFIHQMKVYAMKNESTHPLVKGAVDYIRKEYRGNLTLNTLAQELGVNPSYLSRLLKKETGKNFVDILTECRISQGKYLLEQPGSKVIEVCEQVGYSDYTYFYQVFKRIEGISPSEYKKSSKKI